MCLCGDLCINANLWGIHVYTYRYMYILMLVQIVQIFKPTFLKVLVGCVVDHDDHEANLPLYISQRTHTHTSHTLTELE